MDVRVYDLEDVMGLGSPGSHGNSWPPHRTLFFFDAVEEFNVTETCESGQQNAHRERYQPESTTVERCFTVGWNLQAQQRVLATG